MTTRPDAIELATKTSEDPARIERTRGMQTGWATIAGCLIHARFKMERYLGKAASGEYILWPAMAHTEIPDIVAYLARAWWLANNDGSGLNDAQSLKPACDKAREISATMREIASPNGIVFGYDDPSDAAMKAFVAISKAVMQLGAEGAHCGFFCDASKIEVTDFIATIPRQIARLNQAYMILDQRKHDAEMEALCNGKASPVPPQSVAPAQAGAQAGTTIDRTGQECVMAHLCVLSGENAIAAAP